MSSGQNGSDVLQNSASEECSGLMAANENAPTSNQPDSLEKDLAAGNDVKGKSRWLKVSRTVRIANAVAPTNRRRGKHCHLAREDSFLKRFSTRHGGSPYPETEDDETRQEKEDEEKQADRQLTRFVVNPDESFLFYWLAVTTSAVLYNLWTCIAREAFPEIQHGCGAAWFVADGVCDAIYLADVAIQLRTGYLERGLIVYDAKKLARHYVRSASFRLDLLSLAPLDLVQIYAGIHPLLRFPRFLKCYRVYRFAYMVETMTVYPNMWRVANLSHVLFLGSHWFAAFYFLISKSQNFQTSWGYPYPIGNFSSVAQKYLRSLYWSTLTLTTIGDLSPPETNWE